MKSVPSYTIRELLGSKTKYEGFHINRLESIPNLANHVISPHKHHFIEVFYVTEGLARQKVDFQLYDIECSHLFFISQGQLHEWPHTDLKRPDGYRLMFTEAFLESNLGNNALLFDLIFLNNVYFHPLIYVSPEIQGSLGTYFELALQEYESETPDRHAVSSLLYLMLLQIQRLQCKGIYKSAANLNMEVYRRFVALVEAHYAEKWPVEKYIATLNVSKSKLQRIVNAFAGVSP
ncbi:MAG: hypothetical protein EAZ89_21690, partial [Bacteroidetes bacterium]